MGESQGAAKAAVVGTTETFWLGKNPGTLFADGVAKVGQTSVSWENGKPVVTFPIPGVPGATATATLDAKNMTERVVVKMGSTTTRIHLRRLSGLEQPVEQDRGVLRRQDDRAPKRRGRPRPDDNADGDGQRLCRGAGAGKRAGGNQAREQDSPWRHRQGRTADRQVDTHAAVGRSSRSDGQLDLYRLDRQLHDGGRAPLLSNAVRQLRPGSDNQTFDFELYSPSRFGGLGRPIYKPEYWDKVQELDMWTNKNDPVMTCQPLGVPREGPPRRIMQTDKDVVFFYQGGDAGGGYGEYRIIPTDNRKHDPKKAIEATYLGYTVGRWEGDTLVLDAISFVDSTWLGRGGLFHSELMHVVERFKRQGDVILYDVTVEDPGVLVEPWVLPTRVLRRNRNPNAGLLAERGDCEVYETKDISTQIRH